MRVFASLFIFLKISKGDSVMNENTKLVLDQLNTMALLKNKRRPERWGVLFGKYLDENGIVREDAYTAVTFEGTNHASVLVRVSDFGEFGAPENKPFYSFEKNDWTESPFGVTDADIRGRFATNVRGCCFDIGTHTVLNFMQRRFNPMRSNDLGRIPHIRTIFSLDSKSWEDENLIYVEVGESGQVIVPKLGKPIRLSLLETPENPQGLGAIPPGAYYAEGFNEDSDAVYLRIIKSAMTGMGIYFYDCGKSYYKWNDDEKAYNFPAYNIYNSMTVPVHPQCLDMFEPYPYAVQGSILYSVLKDLFYHAPITSVCLGPQQENSYIMMAGDRRSTQGSVPFIECIIGVLRRGGSGWRC